MVDLEFEQIWGQLTQEAGEQGVAASAGKPEEEVRAEYRKIAERRVRLGLLLAEVGRQNNIEVQADEVTRAMVEQARRFPGQERTVIEYFQKNPEAMAQLRAPIFEDKVIDFIVEMADVSERKVTVEELMREPDEDAAGAAKTA
jgi:trigger factor